MQRGALVEPGALDLDEDAHALTELAHHGDLPDMVVGEGRKGEVVLAVVGLSKSFGGITAAQDLDMELRRGTITALVGPNGAGKTTVFNLLTGAIRPDAGRSPSMARTSAGSARPGRPSAAWSARSRTCGCSPG